MILHLAVAFLLLFVSGCATSSTAPTVTSDTQPVSATVLSTTSLAALTTTVLTGTSTTVATTTATAAVPTTSTLPPCSATGHGPPEHIDVLDNEQIWIATFDGKTLSDERLVAEGASVPDGLMIDGVLHLWWVQAADHTIHHGTLEDGRFTDLGSIVVNGKIFAGMVDPDVVLLASGSIGLSVLDGFLRHGPPGPICYLLSADGQHFSTHRGLLALPDRFDPSLVILDDQWWLAVGLAMEETPTTEIYLGSADGDFSWQATVDGAVPDLSYFEGQFRLLTCTPNGMRHYTSTDGVTWQSLDNVQLLGCDPSTVAGTNLLVYKKSAGMEPPLN